MVLLTFSEQLKGDLLTICLTHRLNTSKIIVLPQITQIKRIFITYTQKVLRQIQYKILIKIIEQAKNPIYYENR
jgi:hypothetical protein